MQFIGRKQELAKLESEYERGGGFVVIYGRRRVGKTTLIKEFLKGKTGFYFLATEEVESQSMRRLAGVVARTTGSSLLQRATFDDWLDLFRTIAEFKPGERKVLVIDEFPYLVKVNAAFPSVLQHAWDEVLRDANVMLVLCGSLIGMMQKHALSYDSPLYGRRSAQMRLAPLSFTDVFAEQRLPFERAVEQYAVTGGIPKYLEFFQEDGRSLREQLEEAVLSKSGFLYEEPNFLLKSESMTSVSYFSIIKAVADGNHKLGKIAGFLGESTSALSPYIANLVDLGFLEKRVPVTEKNPEKSRKGLYFIADNFVRFWFHYVYPYKGELELDNRQIVLDEMGKDFTKPSWRWPTRRCAATSSPACAGAEWWRSRRRVSAHIGTTTAEETLRSTLWRLTTSASCCSPASASTTPSRWTLRSTSICGRRLSNPRRFARPFPATRWSTASSARAASPSACWTWRQRTPGCCW